MSGNDQHEAAQEAAAAAETKRLVQRNFGAAAADYVTSKVHASGEDLAWLVENAALSGGERVLDVATGGGHAAFALALQAAEVVALDLTRPMLEVAQQEAVARGLTNISYVEGDAQALPFADDSFDIVACRQAPHHFPNVRQAVNEWARVLKPGGKLLLVDSTSPEEDAADATLHKIESLRDPSHVRNHRISEWRAYLESAYLSVSSAREWGLFLDIPDWTRRMRTPPESVATIENLIRGADPATSTRLGFQERAGALGFILPVALILAVKN
ncbi:MAG TPA: methyltransferase domain-containing protein [Ktedonobacteraceae bacterium]